MYYNKSINYNNNNNNQLETLFYKVIHNKYLFNKIIEQIHNNDWVVYDSIDQIRFNNRIKFKNIKSFGWMVKNNQIELLKCKLEADDPIEFDSGIYIINCIKEKETIFKLILNSTSIFNKDEIIYQNLHLLDPMLLEIALNPPYSIPISKSMVELIDGSSNSKQVNVIFSHLYRLVYKNNNNNTSCNCIELITALLENIFNSFESLYNTNKLLSKIFNYSNNNNSNISSTITVTPIFKLINVPKLNIEIILFKVVSMDLQITLLKNNLYQISNNLQKYNNKITRLIDNDNDNRSKSNNNNKQLIINLINLFKSQIFNNKNIIKESLIYTTIQKDSLLHLKYLKLFLENNKFNWKEFNFKDYYFDKELKGSLTFIGKVDFEYFKFYIELESQEEYKYFRIDSIDEKINRELEQFIYDDKKEDSNFKLVVDYIKSIPIENERASSISWVNLIRRLSVSNNNQNKLVIIDTETIDYISKNFKENIRMNYLPFELNSIEIYDYAINRLCGIDNIQASYYRQIYQDLVSSGSGDYSCINQAIQVINGIISGNEKELLRIRDIISYSNKIMLIKSLLRYRKVFHSSFHRYLVYLFANDPSSAASISKTSNIINDIGIDSNSVHLIIVRIFRFKNIKILELILSNLKGSNSILYDPSLLNQLCKHLNVHDAFNSLLRERDIYNQAQDVLNTIRFVLDFSSDQLNQESNEKKNKIKFELFQSILNYLFKIILEIKSVTIEEVLEAYQLINSSPSFSVYSNSPLYCVNYLSVRSIKFIKYILESPIFNVNEEILNIQNYIDLSVFSIDYILGSNNSNSNNYISNKDGGSFDIILDQLINQLSYELILKSPDKLHEIVSKIQDGNSFSREGFLDNVSYSKFICKLLNYNLMFLMDIRRHDLVSKHSKIIRCQFSEYYYSEDFNSQLLLK